MSDDAYTYTVGKSKKAPGQWAVFKNGNETKHRRRDYDQAVGKAQRLNQEIVKERIRRGQKT